MTISGLVTLVLAMLPLLLVVIGQALGDSRNPTWEFLRRALG